MPNDLESFGALPAETSISGESLERVAPPTLPRVLADDQLIVLHEVAKCLAQNRGLHATLSLIADKARYLTSSASIALCLLDEERETLDFAAVAGRGASEMVGQRVRVADALPGQTAISGEPLLAFNPVDPVSVGKSGLPTAGGRVGAAFDEPFVLSGGVRSAAVVPIVIDTASVGSLAAINRLDGRSYSGSDLLMLQMLASSASIAIQKDFLGRRAGMRERERNILFRVAQDTAASLDVQKILEGMLETLTASIDMCSATVFLLNDERTHLYIAASYGLTDDEREVQILAEGRIASAALSGVGNAFIIHDADSDPRYEEFLPSDRLQPRSLMVVPLAARDTPSGIIVVMSRQKSAYTKDDLTLLAAVAAQTAIAIENAWLYEDATRRAEEATAVYELSQAVNTSLNRRNVLNFVADSILALLQVDKFALFLYNPDRQCLEINVARNIRRETVASMRPNAERRGIAWWVYDYETPTAVQDVAADHRNRSCPIDDEGVASLVSVPLQAGDKVIGVIHAMSSRRRSFTVAEMELLYTIANQVGTAISNIQTLLETRQKTDDLRRYFRKVARALGASSHPAQTAQSIASLASDMMRIERAVLYLVEGGSGSQQLTILAAHGMRLPQSAQGSQAATVSPAKEISAAWVARRGRILAIDSPGQDPRFIPSTLLAPYVSRCNFYIGVPLKIGNAVLGVLELYGREPREIPADEVRQLVTFAGQSAVALQNSLLVDAAGRRKRDLETIAVVSELLRDRRHPLDGLLTSCIESVLEAADADYAFISGAKLGPKRKGLLIDRGRNGRAESDASVRDTLRRFIEVMREESRSTLVWPSQDMQSWPGKKEARPTIAFQFANDPQVGAICIAREAGRPQFDSADEHLIGIVVNMIGAAL
jgi:GAF domain-containing protein